MNWIKDFAKASFKLYAGNTIDAFQPLDFFHFYPLWYDLWVKRFMSVMDVLGCDYQPYSELKHLLPGPSSMRAIIQKIIPTLAGVDPTNKNNFVRMADFFARMLKESCAEDAFGLTHNPVHSRQELNQITESVPWLKADPMTAKKLGQLIAAAGSLVHGLYNDVVTDFGWDAYGPYDFRTPEQNFQAIIRHFRDLAPKDLWPMEFLTPVKDLKIYQFYENTAWELAYLGCHTVLKSGNPISGLKYFAISVNNQFVEPVLIDTLVGEFSDRAVQLYQEIRKKGFEELKAMVMLQECYQLKKMFEAAYMNWRPTAEMKARTKGKPLATGILPLGRLMTDVAEYQELFHLNSFEKLL